MEHTKCQACFCGLKVNWLGEVKCSAVIPEISPRFPQLPVISVVRETETQLLPDVGAIVTCKVWSEGFQRISKVVVFGFVRGVIGFSYLIRWPASTPDTPRSTSCMWAPHRWRTASGGQSGTRGAPKSHVLFYSTAASLKTESWLTFSLAEKKMCAQQKRTRWASVPPVRLFFVSRYRWKTTSLRIYFFYLAGGNVQKLQTWRYCPSKSGILHPLWESGREVISLPA